MMQNPLQHPEEPHAPTIYLKDISLSYNHRPLFKNFSLTLPAKKCICLLGQSGVGKSTLLRLIADLVTGTDHDHFSATVTTSDKQPIKNRIAYMAQEDLLMPWFNVLNNVLIGYRLRHKPKNKSLALNLLKEVGLSHAIHQMPHTLSGGMRQRTALVRTFIEQKPIILVDEPFSALDAITRYHLQTLAAKLFTDRTVLLVTHDPLEALRLADIIYVLSGTPANITATIKPHGNQPRDPTDPELLKLHAQLIKQLDKGYQEQIIHD